MNRAANAALCIGEDLKPSFSTRQPRINIGDH